jgi:cysteine-rich repeat protein
VDCQDDLCANEPHCQGIERCDNGVDDDGDGFIDLSDSDCSDYPCGTLEYCNNGEDDNDDGLVDCADPFCTAWCVEPVCGNNIVERGEWCDDGNVSDGDGCSAGCERE